ncbi:MAG: ABC transporter ATP-binding protein [Eubacteriaceae bacterium]
MLELKNISLKVEDDIQGEINILKDISLEFLKNKIYVITGPNGGGKSSLTKILMGIYSPTSGSIIYDEENITDYNITQRAKLGISYAFQQPPKFKGIKVKEFLKLAGGESMKGNDINNLLLSVGLCPKDYINREMDGSLSGGELKRIEIASVLARDTNIAVFDEPEAGIDLWSFQKLAETFKNMHQHSQKCIIIISHQERILNLADEVILIAEGKIKEITDKDKFLKEIKHNENCQCSDLCMQGGEVYAN